MKVGVVFASTGGFKILRAVRSLRRSEPDFTIHVVNDVDSNTWRSGGSAILGELEKQPNIHIRSFSGNRWHINGTLNEAMRMMRDTGHDYACMFHDDVVFSPLVENRGHLTSWFYELSHSADLQRASALTLSMIETGIKGADGDLFTGKEPQEWWDARDLESEATWQRLLPGGITPGYKMGTGPVYEVPESSEMPFSLRYFCGDYLCYTRLGPSGQIVPIKTWEKVGGFDEKDGIHYDAQYPMDCAIKNLPHIRVLPNTPHLHIHNQSIGYLDPSTGLWDNVSAAFERKYRTFINSPAWPKWLGSDNWPEDTENLT